MLTRLPPIPRPPHDPTWLTLDSVQGWQEASLDRVVLTRPGRVLQLGVASGGRALTEPSGSFGGLVPPANVAVDIDGGVYLLDVATATLKRFDRACCAFLVVPCFGGVGPGARQLQSPRGITFLRGNLVVADTGNRRVSLFATRGYVLRGFVTPPPSAGLAQPWTPVAVAGDSRGRLFVADPANGSVHRFGRGGDWQTRIEGLGAVRHLAVDCHDRFYVTIDGQPDVRVFGADGTEQPAERDVGALDGRFPPLPFRVDRNGALDFGPPCHAFDPSGAPLPGGAAGDAPKYEPAGTYLSRPLESRIYRCQWHRVLLCGSVPPGTTVTIATHTSDVELPADVVAALPDDDWQTWQVARDLAGEWDCLIRSGGGRHLWLRLHLRGNRAATPCLAGVRLEFPRISLRRYLPGVFGEDPVGADFTDRFLAVFDTTLRSVERRVDEQAALFDARSTPATPDPKSRVDFLSWLASWIGLAVDRQWPEWRRRAFVRDAPKLYDLRGTRTGLWRVLLLFLGWPAPAAPTAPEPGAAPPAPRCTPRPLNCDPPPPSRSWEPPPLILEHYQLRRWLFVGTGRLGEQAVLWGKRVVNRTRLDDGAQVEGSQLIATQDPYRDPFHVYASRFSVFVPACLGASARARKSLESLLRTESPAHTRWHLELVEPRFRIGVQSMIGLDAVVGRYPAGVTLGATPLGSGTVLGESPDGLGGDGRHHPSMRIGVRSQVGSTTRLD